MTTSSGARLVPLHDVVADIGHAFHRCLEYRLTLLRRSTCSRASNRLSALADDSEPPAFWRRKLAPVAIHVELVVDDCRVLL